MHAVCSGCGCSHHSDAVVVAGLMMHCIVVLYLHVAPGCAQLVQLLHVNSGCCLSDRPVGSRLCSGAPEQHIEERLQSRFITRLVQVQRDGKAWRQEKHLQHKAPGASETVTLDVHLGRASSCVEDNTRSDGFIN